MIRRFADLNSREVLGLAIDVEKNNAKRFETVRDFFATQDEAVHDLFDELHRERSEEHTSELQSH